MNFIKALILSIFPVFLFSQNEHIIVGQVTDESGIPLPYVNIGVVGTTTGTVSGLNGHFQLFFPDAIENNGTLRFSMIGHENRSFPLTDFLKKNKGEVIIKLPSVTTNLNEVIVRPRFTKRKTLGMKRSRVSRVTNFAISKKPNQNLGAEIGRKFRLPGKKTTLDTFRFFVAQNNFDTVRFRLNIYSLKNGKPKKNLLKENILIELTEKEKGWIKIDLSDYNLVFSENIAVAVEWVYHSQKGKSLSLPIGLFSSSIHLYKYGSQGKWKMFPSMATIMRLDVRY